MVRKRSQIRASEDREGITKGDGETEVEAAIGKGTMRTMTEQGSGDADHGPESASIDMDITAETTVHALETGVADQEAERCDGMMTARTGIGGTKTMTGNGDAITAAAGRDRHIEAGGAEMIGRERCLTMLPYTNDTQLNLRMRTQPNADRHPPSSPPSSESRTSGRKSSLPGHRPASLHPSDTAR